jgi:hypothetical protein
VVSISGRRVFRRRRLMCEGRRHFQRAMFVISSVCRLHSRSTRSNDFQMPDSRSVKYSRWVPVPIPDMCRRFFLCPQSSIIITSLLNVYLMNKAVQQTSYGVFTIKLWAHFDATGRTFFFKRIENDPVIDR